MADLHGIKNGVTIYNKDGGSADGMESNKQFIAKMADLHGIKYDATIYNKDGGFESNMAYGRICMESKMA